MTSIYQIAEKCRLILGKGSIQALTSYVKDAYASVVKASWYENKQNDVSEVDGVFIYTFTDVVPILDISRDQYYIVVPSSYLRLPNEMGINMVCFMKGQSSPFVRLNSGSVGMWANIKANVLGGGQTYFIEGARAYFPKMTSLTNANLMLKMAIALDSVDVEEQLNIPPDVVDSIVTMVVQKIAPKEATKPENLA